MCISDTNAIGEFRKSLREELFQASLADLMRRLVFFKGVWFLTIGLPHVPLIFLNLSYRQSAVYSAEACNLGFLGWPIEVITFFSRSRGVGLLHQSMEAVLDRSERLFMGFENSSSSVAQRIWLAHIRECL